MAMDKPLYDNLKLKDVSGQMLCHISKRRAAWYIARGLVYFKPHGSNHVVRRLVNGGMPTGVKAGGAAAGAEAIETGELDSVDVMRALGHKVKDPDLSKKRADAYVYEDSTKEDDDGFLYVPEGMTR